MGGFDEVDNMHHSGDLKHLLEVNNIEHDEEVITVL